MIAFSSMCVGSMSDYVCQEKNYRMYKRKQLRTNVNSPIAHNCIEKGRVACIFRCFFRLYKIFKSKVHHI